MEMLGIDIGGSGIKGAPVDTDQGVLLVPRYRVPTPESARPAQVSESVAQVVRHLGWKGPIGCGFPAALRAGVALTASNIHKSWIGTNAAALFEEATGCPVAVVNDADAAGLAEMTFGAGRGRKGVVIVVTLGTGIGTALFTDGCLLPNTELGHIEINGMDAEARASDAARKRERLSWKKWARRLNEYLGRLEFLFWPDLIILGGGASKKYEKFIQYLNIQAEIVPAQFLNEAGIVGAALAAVQKPGES
jgi:polyphosphate glucokinase